jgi:hypothetical protein
MVRWGALLALALGGCRTTANTVRLATAPAVVEEPAEACADTTREVPLPAARRDSIPPFRPVAGEASVNDVFSALSRDYPGGFGGAYRASGRTVLRFTDVEAARAQLGAIKRHLAPHFGAGDLRRIRLVPSRWRYATLEEWRRYLWPRVLHRSDVFRVALDLERNRIVILTENAAQVPSVRSALDALAVPCGLVVVQVGVGPGVLNNPPYP